MEYFVNRQSIVRKIWGKSDTILVVFAGASAEFALSKAVDWLYYTGRLPSDPLGRFFSTVSFARKIIFSERQSALHAIDSITAIHKNLENKRGMSIPDWAYRDVLFMLIDYSIRSFELLERKMTANEKQEVFDVFHRFGTRMQLSGLPATLEEWEIARALHLQQNLKHSHYTDDLFKQYRKHLGFVRYKSLLELQIQVIPATVRELLRFRSYSLLKPLIAIYKFSRRFRVDKPLKNLLLPAAYKKDFESLETP